MTITAIKGTAAQTKGTVLVIDDDPGIVTFLEMALEDEGYWVLASVDGAALRAAHDLRPDVILLDLMMPAMDGREVSWRLRADPVTAAIPIVVMSAQDRLHAATAQLPIDDLLPKPFHVGDLYATVARWTGQAVAHHRARDALDETGGARARPPECLPLRGQGTVLVVDDDPSIVYVLQAALEEAGYRVITAVAHEVVSLAGELQPAVIVLDITMPGLDGVEVRRRLRADPRTAAIPVIATSAGLNLRLHAQEMAAAAYLAKPFDLDHLLCQVEQVGWPRYPAPAPRGSSIGLHRIAPSGRCSGAGPAPMRTGRHDPPVRARPQVTTQVARPGGSE